MSQALRADVCEWLRQLFPALCFKLDMYAPNILIYKKQAKHSRVTHTPIGKIVHEEIRDLRYDYMTNYCEGLTRRVMDGK